MTKRCPPGVICIENVTILIIAIVLIIIFYLIYLNIVRSHSPNTNNTNNIIIKKEKEECCGKGCGCHERRENK